MPNQKQADFHIIEDAFEQTTLHLARLELAVSAVLHRNPNSWKIRQIKVIVGDFVNFSVHCRRLLETCDLSGTAKATKLVGRSPRRKSGETANLSFWDVLGIVIHARRISVSVTNVEPFARLFSEHLEMEHRASVIDYFFIESDRAKSNDLLVPAHSFIETFDTVLYQDVVLILGDRLNRLRTS